MNIKKFILATLGGSITMWLLAGLWHEVIMAKFYSVQADASHEGMGSILLAYLVLAALMAYLYPLVDKKGHPAAHGLKLGLVIGFLWVFPHGLAMAGAHGDSIAYVFKNTVWHLVEQGLGGVIIGLIYGRP